MPFVSVRDIRIYYEIHGTGERLLYIGGSGGDLRRRPSIFDSPLAERFEILAYDQCGLGRTRRAGYTLHHGGLRQGCRRPAGGGGVEPMLCNGGIIRGDGRAGIRPPLSGAGRTAGVGVHQQWRLRWCSYPLHELESLPVRERALKMVLLGDTTCSGKLELPDVFPKNPFCEEAREKFEVSMTIVSNSR